MLSEVPLSNYLYQPSGVPPEWAPLAVDRVKNVGCLYDDHLYRILAGKRGVGRAQSDYASRDFRRDLENLLAQSPLYAYVAAGRGAAQASGRVIVSSELWRPEATGRFYSRLAEMEVYVRFLEQLKGHNVSDPRVEPTILTSAEGGRGPVKWPGIGFLARGLYPRSSLSLPIYVWAMPPHGKIPEEIAYLLDGMAPDPRQPDWPQDHPRFALLVLGDTMGSLVELGNLIRRESLRLQKDRGWFVKLDGLYVQLVSWIYMLGARTPFEGWFKPPADQKAPPAGVGLFFDPARWEAGRT